MFNYDKKKYTCTSIYVHLLDILSLVNFKNIKKESNNIVKPKI